MLYFIKDWKNSECQKNPPIWNILQVRRLIANSIMIKFEKRLLKRLSYSQGWDIMTGLRNTLDTPCQ